MSAVDIIRTKVMFPLDSLNVSEKLLPGMRVELAVTLHVV